MIDRFNAVAGAAVVVLSLAMVHTLVQWNEEKAARLAAEERHAKLVAAREKERCDEFKDRRSGMQYRWCRVKVEGDS